MSRKLFLLALPFLVFVSSCAHGPRTAAGGAEMDIRLRNVTKRTEGTWIARLDYSWLGGEPIAGTLTTSQITSGFTQENRVYAQRPSGIMNVNHLNVENLMARMGQEGQIRFRDTPPDAAGISGSKVRFFIKREGRRISNIITFDLP